MSFLIHFGCVGLFVFISRSQRPLTSMQIRWLTCFLHNFEFMHFCAWMSTSLFSLWQTLTSARFWSGKIRLWQSRFSARPALSGCVHRILVLTRVECRRSRSSCSSLVRHSAPLVARGGAVHAPLVGRAPRLACHHGLLGLLGVVRGVHRAVVGEVCRVGLKDECRFVLFPWFPSWCVPEADSETEVQMQEVLVSCQRARLRWRGEVGGLEGFSFKCFQVFSILSSLEHKYLQWLDARETTSSQRGSAGRRRQRRLVSKTRTSETLDPRGLLWLEYL